MWGCAEAFGEEREEKLRVHRDEGLSDGKAPLVQPECKPLPGVLL